MSFKTNRNIIRWKRFSRANYAAFMSMHREVAIGVISVAMLGSAGLKAATPIASGAAGANATATSPEADALDDAAEVISLADVNVTGGRVPLAQIQAPRLVTVITAADIAAAAVHSVNDLLEYAAGVDVRQRGEFGVQTDISVRGGTFDQITLLLNGINISSAHTGHLSADFPITVQDIERIEVLEGPSARVFGTSAFTGVINIVTRSEADAGALSLSGGDYGYGSADLRLSKQHAAGTASDGSAAHLTHHLSGGYSRADGNTPNSDFENTHAFYQAQYRSSDVQANLQLGYSYKPYGANTFYGASSTDQWESNERYLGALNAEAKVGAVHIAPTLYWNRWFDHYQWHKGSPSGENFHQADTYGAAVNSWVDSRYGKTSLGVEMRNEGIYSTKLGKLMEEDQWKRPGGHDGGDATEGVYYKYHDQRTNVSAFLEHDVLLSQWTVSLGVLANMNTGLDSKWRFYPGVDVAYRPTDTWKLFASWNMALRMPTWTDLYYSGSNIEGNDHLRPERTNDVSLGARFRPQGWKVEGQLFYSHKSNMIDWVIYEGDETNTFRSGNFTLDNLGAEVSIDFLPRELWGAEHCALRKIGVQYAYIDEDIAYNQPIVKSKYAMEYLHHKVVAQAETRLVSHLNLTAAWRWQDRVGEGNAPYALLDARLSWDAARWSAYADCSNLLNKTYYDYNIVRQPGRWAKVGVCWKFGL
jgi:iron complex outermembrane receptor protein